MKKFVSLFLIAAAVFSVLTLPLFATDGTDSVSDGMPKGKGIRSFDEIDDPDGDYYLLEDIVVLETYTDEFRGTLDGNGKTVVTGTALFRRLKDATVKNFTVTGKLNNPSPIMFPNESSGSFYAAVAIVANGKTTFENIRSSVEVTMNKYLYSPEVRDEYTYGGIVGTCTDNESELYFLNCINSGTIDSHDSAGGIFGSLQRGITVTFRNCRNGGNIVSRGHYAGGICAKMTKDRAYDSSDGTNTKIVFENCVNNGSVESREGNAGGIACYIGADSFDIKECINNGKVSAKEYVGGIIGYAYGFPKIQNCRNNANLEMFGVATQAAGGIVGYINCADGGTTGRKIANIVDCVNKGTVCRSASSGGIVGGSEGMVLRETCIYIRRCTNDGEISPSDYAGGIMGLAKIYNSSAYVVVDRCINTADTWGYIYSSQLLCYADSSRNIVSNNIMAGRTLDANSNPAYKAKLVFLACAYADMTSIFNNFTSDSEIDFLVYSSTEKSRIPFAVRAEGTVNVVDSVAMKTGEVTFRINEYLSEEVFRQTIGRDSFPSLSDSSLPVLKNSDGIYVNDLNAPPPAIGGTETFKTNMNSGAFGLNPAKTFIKWVAIIVGVILSVSLFVFGSVKLIKFLKARREDD